MIVYSDVLILEGAQAFNIENWTRIEQLGRKIIKEGVLILSSTIKDKFNVKARSDIPVTLVESECG